MVVDSGGGDALIWLMFVRCLCVIIVNSAFGIKTARSNYSHLEPQLRGADGITSICASRGLYFIIPRQLCVPIRVRAHVIIISALPQNSTTQPHNDPYDMPFCFNVPPARNIWFA